MYSLNERMKIRLELERYFLLLSEWNLVKGQIANEA